MVLPALLTHSLERRRRKPQAPWGGGIRRGSVQGETEKTERPPEGPFLAPAGHKRWWPHRALLPDPVFIQRTPL